MSKISTSKGSNRHSRNKEEGARKENSREKNRTPTQTLVEARRPSSLSGSFTRAKAAEKDTRREGVSETSRNTLIGNPLSAAKKPLQ